MNCSEARQRWHLRFDEGTPDAALDEHLAQCLACRQYAGQMSGLCAALDRIRHETEAVVAPPAKGSSRRVIRLMPWLAAAAAVALAFVIYRPATQEPHVPPSLVASRDESTQPASPLGITLHGESKTQLLAVAFATDQPNVQVYRLYPRLLAADRKQHEPSPQGAN